MSDELINKTELLLALIDKGQNSKRYKWGESWELNLAEIMEVLNSAKTGRWIHEEFESDKSITGYFLSPRCECSVCGTFVDYECSPCPCCGSIMK